MKLKLLELLITSHAIHYPMFVHVNLRINKLHRAASLSEVNTFDSVNKQNRTGTMRSKRAKRGDNPPDGAGRPLLTFEWVLKEHQSTRRWIGCSGKQSQAHSSGALLSKLEA